MPSHPADKESWNIVLHPSVPVSYVVCVAGGVALYRMTLHRVWSVGAPEEGVTVTALCWRPDGRLLAVGYTSGGATFNNRLSF